MEKRITAVLIDTSAYHNRQCDFSGITSDMIPMFIRLMETNHILVLSHPILNDEILKHIRDSQIVERAGKLCTSLRKNKAILEYAGIYTKSICNKINADSIADELTKAYEEFPPFSDAKGASDKGFKDCLLWLSILDYFKKNGEDEVIFVTDDKSAFLHNTDVLESEFKTVTGKVIHIHPNTYYKELIKKPAEVTEEVVEEPEAEDLPNLETMRAEIEEAVESLRGIDYENYYGDPMWSSTFSTSKPFDKEYVKAFIGG